MPYSFTHIEKVKKRNIVAAYAFLIALYVGAAMTLFWLCKNYGAVANLLYPETQVPVQAPTPLEAMTVVLVAGMVATLQWLLTVNNLTVRICRTLGAAKPDMDDERQVMFCNIVAEVVVATGGSAIQPMIIPSAALNACAISDGETVPVIAVTKGMLYRLNRPQLEAVVAHEAAHIVSGDSEGTTVISAMFEIFGVALRGVRFLLVGMMHAGSAARPGRGYVTNVDDDSDVAGALPLRAFHFLPFLIMVIIVLLIVNFLAAMMRMFISRQREYRADATSTRLTRNPLALAEALTILQHYRHGFLTGADGLQTIFFLNPRGSLWDADMMPFSGLFATHPPTQKRIAVLLDMAHAQESDLDPALQVVKQRVEEERTARVKEYSEVPGGMWYVQRAGEWTGPFMMATLVDFDWITPQTPVKRVGTQKMFPLAQLPGFAKAQEDSRRRAAGMCPACRQPLENIRYERCQVKHCPSCGGYLAGQDAVGVILARKEATFDKRIQGMAQALVQERAIGNSRDLFSSPSPRKYCCEKCRFQQPRMVRRLFNRYYPIEVDRCPYCALTWFDKDELEIMQAMYEIRQAAERARMKPA